MHRLGNHRNRPERSQANQARAAIARLDRQIADARARKDAAAVDRLETEKAWLIANSLVP